MQNITLPIRDSSAESFLTDVPHRGIIMNRFTLVLAASAICFSQAARAGDSGAYLGAGFADGLLTACATATSNCNNFSVKSNNHVNPRLVGGYDFNKYIGIEAGLSGLGSYEIQDSYGSNVGTVKVTATTLAARGGYKFPHGFSVFGKVGLAVVKTQYTPAPGWLFIGNNNQRSTGGVFGLGWQYDFNDSVGFRMSLEAVSYKDDGYKGGVAGTNLMAIFKL
jgi:hypothetical protein